MLSAQPRKLANRPPGGDGLDTSNRPDDLEVHLASSLHRSRRTTIRQQHRHLPLDARHPPVDASISTWMSAGHLHVDAPTGLRASSIGCLVGDDAPRQTKRDHAIVAQPPDSLLRVPPPARLLHSVADCCVGKGDAQPDDLVGGKARRWWFPIAFGHEELDGLEPFLPLRVVAIPHADKAVTVLREKLPRALLPRPEAESDPRGGGGVGRTPTWRASGRRSGGGYRRGTIGISGASLVDRGQGSAPAALGQDRVGGWTVPDNTAHFMAGAERLA